MNLILWIVQILFAIHTGIGAFWKLGNAESLAPMFPMIPLAVWTVISILEFVVVLTLLAPLLKRSLGKYTPIAAGVIGAEMLIYCGLYLLSGATDYMPIYYWLAVAVVSALVAYGRVRTPIA